MYICNRPRWPPIRKEINDSKFRVDRVKRIWYLSPMRAAKVQASLRIRAVSPEPPLLAHTSKESRGTFRQKARSLAFLNGWTCAVKICHDGMLEDTNSLDGAQTDSGGSRIQESSHTIRDTCLLGDRYTRLTCEKLIGSRISVCGLELDLDIAPAGAIPPSTGFFFFFVL